MTIANHSQVSTFHWGIFYIRFVQLHLDICRYCRGHTIHHLSMNAFRTNSPHNNWFPLY